MPCVIKTAAAHMPSSCKYGPYRRVAVLRVKKGVKAEGVKMISSRARGVVEVVQTWERLWVGKGVRSAYARALAEAREVIAHLTK